MIENRTSLACVLLFLLCTTGCRSSTRQQGVFPSPPEPSLEQRVDYFRWLNDKSRNGDGESASRHYRRAVTQYREDRRAEFLSEGPLSYWEPRARIERWVEGNANSLESFAAGSREQICFFRLKPKSGSSKRVVEMDAVHAIILPRIAHCMAARARLRAAEGDHGGAVDDALVLLATARHLQELPTGMEYNAGLKIARTGYSVLMHLPVDAAGEVRYNKVLRRLRQGDAPPRSPEHILSFEKAVLYDLMQIDLVDANRDGMFEVVDATEIGWPRAEIEPPQSLEEIVELINGWFSDWERLFRVTKYASFEYEAAKLDRERSRIGSAMYALPLSPVYRHIGIDFRRCLTTRNATHVLLAAHAYRQRHGEWPRTVDAAVGPEGSLLTSDAFGEELRYRMTDDSLLVYSIGEDGRDDEGKVVFDAGQPIWASSGDFVFWPPPRYAKPR